MATKFNRLFKHYISQSIETSGYTDEMRPNEYATCPNCRKPFKPFDTLRDDFARQEFGRSGLCQACQDMEFGAEDEIPGQANGEMPAEDQQNEDTTVTEDGLYDDDETAQGFCEICGEPLNENGECENPDCGTETEADAGMDMAAAEQDDYQCEDGKCPGCGGDLQEDGYCQACQKYYQCDGQENEYDQQNEEPEEDGIDAAAEELDDDEQLKKLDEQDEEEDEKEFTLPSADNGL